MKNPQQQLKIKIAELEKELAVKNRELEIEGSLERVRAQAMGMMKPEDLLSVCEKLFTELQTLDFNNIRNAIIHILNDEKGFFLDYDFSDFSGGSITTTFYNSHPILNNFLKQIKSANDAFAEVVIDANQLSDWKEFRRRNGQPDDSRLDNIPALYYYFYSIGIGDIGISTLSPINENQLELLKRFRNVFELAYRRFMDIQRAEAQAKEAKIEAALEKIRAVAMSMMKPDDLLNICEELFKEFQKLGFGELRNAMINIHNDEKGTFLNYDYSDEIGKSINHLTYNIHPIIEKQIKQIRSANDAFSETSFTGKDLEEWKKFRKKIGEKDDARINNISELYYYFYSIGTGSIGISTFSSIGDEKLELLKRFRNVFSLSYQRYSDIALAEEQAREAQIELALERVRARTMGMQKSEELKEVIQVVYEQFIHLNIKIGHTGFVMDYKARDDYDIWIADPLGVPSQVVVPYFDSVYYNRFNEAKEKGEDFFATNLSFEEKNTFYKRLFEYVPGLPEDAKEFYFNCPGLAASTVLLENVCLYIENFSGTPYTDEENNTLMRFGKVFQQTYTRFLDLQKAEAQAREAQIEAALEKVRGKAMAMHNSVDLTDAAGTVFNELNNLGIKPIRSGFVLLSKDSQIAKLYPTTSFDNKNTVSFTGEFEFTGHPVYEKQYQSWEKKENYFPVLEGDILKSYYKILAKGISVPYKNFPTKNKKQFGAFLPFSEGFLFTWSDEPYSEKEINILDRFKGILDLTIRRYLDLKNAEAQAREAQIELGLERVRARAMAMQKSDELSELVDTVFKELTKLDFALTWCIINIIDESTMSNTVWAANPDINKAPESYHMLFEDYPFHHAMMKGWKERKTKDVYVLEAQEKKVYDEYLFNETEFRRVPATAQATSRAMEKYVVTFSFSNFGGVQTVGNVPLSDANLDILSRFGKVFDLTYTRFNDLKLAEAQTREAQIEAALEKVRASAMAMYNSSDLSAAASLVFTQLRKLGINPIRAGVCLLSKGSRKAIIYTTTTSLESDALALIGSLDMSAHYCFEMQYNSWLKNENYFPVLSAQELKSYYEVLSAQLSVPSLSYEQFQHEECGYYLSFSEGLFYAWSDHPYSESEINILNRFKGIIDLTFRRYLDLQKVEAQAREAKIEASLERVRSKAMAMHGPNDLSETVSVFFKELRSLNVLPWRCGVGQINEETKTTFLTTTSNTISGESFEVSGTLQQEGHPVLDGIFEHWKMQKEYYPVLHGNDIKKYYGIIKPQIAYPKYPLYAIQYGHFIFIKEGFVFAWTENKLSEEELGIFRRFASVLSLTYRRYLDLKEAEARNKIIQAENERKTKELEEARQLQFSMLPKKLPQIPNLQLAAHMRTATEVGGDYYDFIVQENGVLNIGFGDATGHGLQAGTMITLMKGFFTSDGAKLEPRAFMNHCSNMIKEIKLGRILMSFSLLRFDNSKLLITSAGMPPVYYYNNEKKETEEILIPGMPLGAMKGFTYKLVEKKLRSGDTLLLLTDGLPEQTNSNDEMFNYSRVKNHFNEIADKSPEEIINSLVKSADDWMNGKPQADDITFIVIKVV